MNKWYLDLIVKTEHIDKILDSDMPQKCIQNKFYKCTPFKVSVETKKKTKKTQTLFIWYLCPAGELLLNT